MANKQSKKKNHEEKHMIEDAIFDFAFASECASASEADVLGVLIQETLLPIVDEVFSEVSQKREGFIAQLTIDLGPIDVSDFQEALQDRLRIRLKDALEAQLSLRNPAPSRAEKMPSVHPNLELFESFLTRGHLPSRRVLEKGHSVDDMLSAVFKTSAADFARFLRKSKHQPQILKRLIYQSSEEHLAKIVSLLSPLNAESLFVLVKKLKQVLTRIPEVSLSAPDLAHEIWTRLLALLLQDESGCIDENRFISAIRERLAAGDKTLKIQIDQVFGDLGLVATPSVSDAQTYSPRQKADDVLSLESLAQLKHDLRTAIQEGNAVVLQKIWPRVLKDHVLLLKGILLDSGRKISVRRILSRQFSDEMLSDIVWVIDERSRDFVHEIVTRPALFAQVNHKEIESENETLYQLWEFTLSYLILERGSHFNKKSYLGSLLAQMAAHENSSYADLLQGLIARLDVTIHESGLKSEIRDLLFELETEGEESRLEVPSLVSDVARSDVDQPEVDQPKPSRLVQAYGDYETLYRAFLGQSDVQETDARSDEALLVLALESLARLEPALLLRLFRTLQVEARGVDVYRHAFSAQMLLKFIKTFVSFRLHSVGTQSDLMQALEKRAADQKDLNHYYAQILFCLIQNELIDLEVISDAETVSPQALSFNEKEEIDPAADDTRLDLLRTKISEALVRGKPQAVQDIWPEFLRDQARWLRQALFVYGREARVRETLSKTFPDGMLLDLVRLAAPEAGAFVFEIVTQPQLFQSRPRFQEQVATPFEGKKERKAVLWQFTLSYLLAERGSRFNKKSYLSHLITQMAAHQNMRPQDILLSLTEGFETIESSRAAKSEVLYILRELSQGHVLQKAETKSETDENTQTFDVEVACRDLKYFLSQGAWPKNNQGRHTADSFLKMLRLLFQFHRESVSRLFAELQSRDFSQRGSAIVCPAEIFVDLIKMFLSLENPEGISVAPEFMQAMAQHALKANNQTLYYQRIFARLIAKKSVDFEAILLQERSEVFDDLAADAPEGDSAKDSDAGIVVESEIADPALSSLNPPKKQLSSEDVLKADFALFEKMLVTNSILSTQTRVHFIKRLEVVLLRAPEALAQFLGQALENRVFASRLLYLLPESLLVRLLLLLKPIFFESVLRIADLVASAACAREIALSPARISRLKWQFIFQYLFEEGRRFHATTFVSLFTKKLAQDAYYSDVAAFRRSLRSQLESHLIFGVKSEVVSLMEIFSLIDRENLPKLPLFETSAASEVSAEIPLEGPAFEAIFEEMEEEWDETIHLTNAGLVIAAPYLERLFALLHLTEGGVFKDLDAAQRGVHLLQFLVNEKTDSPEYQLVLNKILCGLKSARPIEREICITPHEKEVVEGLIKGMIANWKQIGETSLQGFRESFLAREGTLRRKGNDWHLEVSPKAFDILLDYIPWSFSIVKFPWMQRVIHVKWR